MTKVSHPTNEEWTRFLSYELARERRSEITDHLVDCAICRRDLAAMPPAVLYFLGRPFESADSPRQQEVADLSRVILRVVTDHQEVGGVFALVGDPSRECLLMAAAEQAAFILQRDLVSVVTLTHPFSELASSKAKVIFSLDPHAVVQPRLAGQLIIRFLPKMRTEQITLFRSSLGSLFRCTPAPGLYPILRPLDNQPLGVWSAPSLWKRLGKTPDHSKIRLHSIVNNCKLKSLAFNF